MSELKFKSYGELGVAESLSDASHVIVEENGEVKRFPAKGMGGSAPIAFINVDEDTDSISVTGCTYSDIMEALEGGGLPEVVLVKTGEYYGNGMRSRLMEITPYDDEIVLSFYGGGYVWNPDNTVTRQIV